MQQGSKTSGEQKQKEKPFKKEWLETVKENFKNCKRSAVDREKWKGTIKS